MVLATDTIDGRDLSNEVGCELLPKKSKSNAVFAVHHTVKLSHLTSCTLLTRRSALV